MPRSFNTGSRFFSRFVVSAPVIEVAGCTRTSVIRTNNYSTRIDLQSFSKSKLLFVFFLVDQVLRCFRLSFI
jgi:hypothetical protein